MHRVPMISPILARWRALNLPPRDSRASDNNKVVAIVSGITVADHGRRTIEKLIDSCGIAQQT